MKFNKHIPKAMLEIPEKRIQSIYKEYPYDKKGASGGS